MTDKLLVASEYTDPTFWRHDVIDLTRKHVQAGTKCGLLLITKEPACAAPIWDACDGMGVPVILHATVTGLGGTDMEPHAVPYMTALIRLLNVLHDRPGRPERTVIRIDPLIPGVTDYGVVDKIIGIAAAAGITRCRTSVVDYYPHVRRKLTAVRDSEGHRRYPTQEQFQAPRNVVTEHLRKIADLCSKHEVNLYFCAEGMPGPGCAWKDDWPELELRRQRSKQRASCMCDVPKHDLLRGLAQGGNGCQHGCLYCYWGKFT